MTDPTIFGRLLADWDHAEHAAVRAEQAAGDWFTRRHGATQATAAAAATVEAAPAAQPEENPMALLDNLKAHVAQDLAEAEAKLKDVDEEALGMLNAVTANPEAAGVLKDLAGLAAVVGIPEGAITGVAAGLKTLLSLYAQPAVNTEAPADPAPAPAPAQ